MVSSGKHSRGNCVLDIRSWLVSSAVPPVPKAWAKKVQDKIPMNAKIGYGTPGGTPSCFVCEKMMMKMPSMASGAMRAQASPSVACLYWARMSRSAKVKTMSRLAHRLRIDVTSRAS